MVEPTTLPSELLPSASPTSSPPLPSVERAPPPQPLARSLHYSLQYTTSFLKHLSNHFSYSSTLDTSLLTICYTLRLLTSFLPTKPPSSVLLTRLFTSLVPLTALLEDFRIRLRLVALIPILASASQLLLKPPRDTFSKALSWTQISSLVVFQAAENAAYLAEKGVLAWKKEKIDRWWVWSSRAWALWTGLELLRLDMERRGRKAATTSFVSTGTNEKIAQPSMTEEVSKELNALIERKENPDLAARAEILAEQVKAFKEQADEDRDWWRGWRREVGVNAAYLPMTLHYSVEKGLLTERTMAALGVSIAWLTLGEAWKGSGY